MKLKHLVIALGFIGLLQATGCSSTPENTLTAERVVVSQAGDSQLACTDLEPKLEGMESDVKEMLVEKQNRSNKTFTMTAIIDMTMALMSSNASAGNRIDRSTLDDFTQPEMARIQSLADRHHHLMVISKDKQCEFVPKIEGRMTAYKNAIETTTPAPDEQSYRKRAGQN